MQQKIITLIFCFALSPLFASELPLKKSCLKPSAQNTVFPLSELPIELQLRVAYFIKEPTVEQTVKKIKAYLLTNSEKAAFLADNTFTKNLLVHLQERDHHSILEHATRMASSASKKVAHHLRQEGQKCWQEYVSIPPTHKWAYPVFVFQKHTDPHLIPSLLFFALSNDRNLEEALNGHREAALVTCCYNSYSSPAQLLYTINIWIASGLLTSRKNLENLWYNVASNPYKPSSVVVARILIDAGYTTNCILEDASCEWGYTRVKRLSPTLLDFIMQRIRVEQDAKGIDTDRQMITSLYQLLRMVVAAGGKSNYELQQA